MTVFLLARAFECGNLHSTGISRFIAKPVPVPLRSRRLRTSFHVGSHTRATITQELLRTPGLLHDRCPTRCSLRPRGLVSRSPVTRTHAWPARSVNTIGSHPNLPDLGATVQIQGTHPSPRTTLAVNSAIPGGWIDLTRKGFDLLATAYHILFNNGSEPG